ncbi:hypothetical protein ABZS86_30980 [Streptomyces sp. NPDC005355]|uniref:Pepco domain-containing protein n=1 Tax=Streptomyces sp. NPDC005355 TaxID=3157038 RepID=UPI0033BDBEEE
MGDNTLRLDEQTLEFWVEVTDEDSPNSDSKSIFNRNGDATLRAVPLGPLRKNLAEAVDALQKVFADVAARDDALRLAEAQLSFQVSPPDPLRVRLAGVKTWVRCLPADPDVSLGR